MFTSFLVDQEIDVLSGVSLFCSNNTRIEMQLPWRESEVKNREGNTTAMAELSRRFKSTSNDLHGATASQEAMARWRAKVGDQVAAN
jgi:hypothetical protein